MSFGRRPDMALVVMIVVASLTSACGGVVVSPTASGSLSTDLSPPPGTSLPPSNTALTCGGDERFGADALAGPGIAEFEPGPLGDALRAELATSDGSVPASGWHRVWAVPDRVVFVAQNAAADEEPWSMVGVMLGPDGWTLDVIGGCRLAPAMPAGIGTASFWIDPAVGRPAPDATEIAGRIVERACASGEAPGDRVLDPIIVMDDQAVVITVTIRTRPGGQDCPGNPDVPIVIELAEPLGDRAILDGSVFPPRDASIVPD